MSNKQLSIALVRGLARTKPLHRETIRALGLSKIGDSVVRPDNPSVRGMVRQVGYLVKVTAA